MSTTITAVGPPETYPPVRLFSRTAIGWLSCLFGFPAGMLLLADDWRRLGQRGRRRRYVAGAGPTVDECYVVIVQFHAPRWRNWLARLNLAWH